MRDGYVVRVFTRGVTLTMNVYGKFVVVTAEPRRFSSPRAASDYMRELKEWDNPIACQPYIEGPRGGEYHVASGKRMR